MEEEVEGMWTFTRLGGGGVEEGMGEALRDLTEGVEEGEGVWEV